MPEARAQQAQCGDGQRQECPGKCSPSMGKPRHGAEGGKCSRGQGWGQEALGSEPGSQSALCAQHLEHHAWNVLTVGTQYMFTALNRRAFHCLSVLFKTTGGVRGRMHWWSAEVETCAQSSLQWCRQCPSPAWKPFPHPPFLRESCL